MVEPQHLLQDQWKLYEVSEAYKKEMKCAILALALEHVQAQTSDMLGTTKGKRVLFNGIYKDLDYVSPTIQV
ncbi:hypothetical protein L6452_37115 [Arctium lappa]|uniref:Uncharacterized protein n=1 Tax=Arctium lappa TaxID=4217 RepID=A0ACB8Y259_ARCLA|nr:hypothetical protein L6452_37115 [Arctium lappa]